jgi:hypothetical protein
MNKDITTCLGYQQITMGVPAISLTVPTIDPNTGLQCMPTHAVIIVEGTAIRYRDDGTDPSIAVGMLVQPGSVIIYDGDFKKLRLIRTAAGSTLNISWYK